MGEVDLYFVAFSKNDQVTHLCHGPFISDEDAKDKLATKRPSRSGKYVVVKAAFPVSQFEVVEAE